MLSQDESTTVGVFFEIMTSKKQEAAGLDGAAGQTFYLQFKTTYLNGQTGRMHCRVTTVTRQYGSHCASSLIHARLALGDVQCN